MRAEFQSRPEFAEVAEALGVNTDQVLLVGPGINGRSVAMWTPSEWGTGDVWAVALRRDEEGILRADGPRRRTGKTTEDLLAEIEGRLEVRLPVPRAPEPPPISELDRRRRRRNRGTSRQDGGQ
jgi:hypothetical protein